MKKKIIIIVSLLVVALSIVGLYQTYAISSNVEGSDNNYTITLNGDTNVTIPANTTKTVYYKVKNSNNGKVQYGIGYKSNNVIAKVYSNSESTSTGLIEKGDSKFIKLHLENPSTSSETITLITILGYENGGELIVPTGYKLITSFFSENARAAKKISELFEEATKEEVINNDVTYQYDTTNSLIQDVGGNIRYYGASPNNYIYFNCDDYASQTNETCELWRIIGVFDGKLKIMRDMPIGKYSWDNKGTISGAETNDGKNEWSEARLMKMLNPGYDSELGGSLYWNRQNGTCYSGKIADNTKECDMSSIGLKNDTTKSAIADNIWYIRGYSNGELYPNQIYRYEVADGEVFDETRSTIWTGKIGLPSVSDYLFASDFKICNEYANGYPKNYSCRKNWIVNAFTNVGSGVSGWFITPGPFNSSSVKYLITGTNALSSVSSNLEWYVSPTLYLNKDIDISSGDGTSDNPYQLKIEIQQYTITYNANGGSGAPSSQNKKHGESITLSNVKPTKTGYTFTGWNTNSDGSGTGYSVGSTYSNDSDITLYAQWQINTYTITYNANGGSGAPSNQTKKYGESITLSSTKPTRVGYTFTGWNTNSDGSGTGYSAGGTYSNNSNVTLYAQWQSVSSYTVTVYLQGELIDTYTVVPGNDISTRFGVSSDDEIRYKTCTNGASITATVGRLNNMSVANITITNITSDTVCNLYYTLI